MNNKAYERYVNALNNASLLAQGELAQALEKIDLDRPRMARNAFIDVMVAIIEKYSGVASLAAAEYYEQERRDALDGDYEALLAEPVSPERIEASVRYAAGHLFREESNEIQQRGVRKLFDGEG